MEIHRFEKRWFVVSLVLIIAFIATIVYGAAGVGVQMIDDDGGQIDPSNVRNAQGFSDPGVHQAGDGEYDVYVIAYQFAFEPGSNDPIRVPADTRITFHVTSSDTIHGFSVVGTNLNTMVIPGQVAKFTTVFNETGTYGVVCHEYCGDGHHTMAGTIEVVPEDEFDGGSNTTDMEGGN